MNFAAKPAYRFIGRAAIILLWVSALLLIFVGANLYDPYLTMMRGARELALVVAELLGLGALIAGGFWRRRGPAAKVLVLLWCMPPVAAVSATVTFELRKHAVLDERGPRARELGMHFIVGYRSFDEVAPLVANGLVGGIYVTRHNVGGRSLDAVRSEIARLQDLRRAAGLPALIVATDQEGGIVSHLSPPLTALPALSSLAALPPEERSEKAEAYGRIHGCELASMGITLNFAPVVDLLRDEGPNPFDFNSLISRRAIASDPAVVAAIAAAYARGLEAFGVEATVKHFPGLGRVRQDTHHFLADIDTSVEDLDGSDWLPFHQVLARSSAVLMVGHVVIKALDPERAASHSKPVIDGLIRRRWGYDGIIITDDLVMGAIYEHGVCSAVTEALNAGADLLLVAFDGLQFYRLYDCALVASNEGRLDETMLKSSLARLERNAPRAAIATADRGLPRR